MTYCTNCGDTLGAGRFCLNCGQPIEVSVAAGYDGTAERLPAALADTAERPVFATGPPPPLPEPESSARFPLYADEVEPVPPHPRTEQGGRVLPPPPPPVEAEPDEPDRIGWPVWTALAAALLLAAGVAAWLAVQGPGEPAAEQPGGTTAAADAGSGADKADGGRTGSGRTSKVGDLATDASAKVPAVAPPGQDLRGRPVRYDAANLFDGKATTTWRMAGNGRGEVITISLPAGSEVTQVGLINGYAKVVRDGAGREVSWYNRTRKVAAVSWAFDDGTVVRQQLRMNRPGMQTLKVDREVTDTIRLTLLRVTPPAPGPAGRNYTAISEIRLRGVPG